MSTTTNEHETDEVMAGLAELNPEPVTQDAPDMALFARITAEEAARSSGMGLLPVYAGGAGAVVAIAVVTGVIMTRGGSGSEQTPVDGPGGGGFAALCVEIYSPENLRNREFAFVGVAESIQDTYVTFRVERYFKGDRGEAVTLEAGQLLFITADNDYVLELGDRFLVSGEDGFAWGCGFTQPYSDSLAAEWEAALQ